MSFPGLPALKLLSVFMFAAGSYVYLSCCNDFAARGQGTPAFWDAPERFVKNRWFLMTRNPMYLGVATMIVGVGFWVGSVSILLYAVVFLLAFHIFVVGYEEPTLRRRYGASYREYCQQVPRWLPRQPYRRV